MREQLMSTWNDAPLNDVIDHVLHVYHRPLHSELPRLAKLTEQAQGLHGSSAPPNIGRISGVYQSLHDDLEIHLRQEERVLFPFIRSGRRITDQPIGMMSHDHDTTFAGLQEIRALTYDFSVPDSASTQWRTLWSGLAQFEIDLLEHFLLEDSVLFPRAMKRR